MHIGLVTACYKPVLNGVTRMVALYAKGLLSKGHTVSVFTLGPKSEVTEDRGVTVYRSAGWPLGRTGYYAARRYSSEAQQAILNCDILHAHHPSMALEFGVRYKRVSAPIVFTNHTRYDLYATHYLPLWPQSLRVNLGRQLAARFWPQRVNQADHIIACNDAIAHLLRKIGVKKPIKRIPNGIDLSRFINPPAPKAKTDFGWQPDRSVIAYVGRLSAEKRVEALIDAFYQAHRKNQQLRLLLVGDGPQRKSLEKKIAHLLLQPAVHFTGETSTADVANALAAADFFATASVSEIDPLTIIEAMAAGLPVVAQEGNWTADCIPSGTGLIVENTEALGEKMLYLAAHPMVRNTLSAGAAEAAQSRSFETTLSMTLTLYRSLLDRQA